MIGWKMSVDGDFMPNLPRNLASKRPNIPIIFGNNRDEWAWVGM